jgi:peptide/nickel transport system ATP-binding protein
VVSDEIIVLNRGRIVEQGRTKQVLQHPRDSYTVQLLNAVANPFAAGDGARPSPEALPARPPAEPAV